MPIDSINFKSSILNRIAVGDLLVLNDINEDNVNVTEKKFHITFTPLLVASCNGFIEVVNMLLAKNDDDSYKFPDVIQNISACDNYFLIFAA